VSGTLPCKTHSAARADTLRQDSDHYWLVTPAARAALVAVLSEAGAELAITWQARSAQPHTARLRRLGLGLAVPSCRASGRRGSCSSAPRVCPQTMRATLPLPPVVCSLWLVACAASCA